MTDFLTRTKELMEGATKGEWLRDWGPDDFDGAGSDAYAHIYVNYDSDEEDAPDETLIADYNILVPEGHNNAALVCHLVNAAPLIVEMVEAAKGLANTADGLRIEEAGIRELIGHTNWEVLRHWIDAVRTAEAKLNGSAS